MAGNEANPAWGQPIIVTESRAVSMAAVLGGAVAVFVAVALGAVLAASRGSLSNHTVAMVCFLALLYALGIALFAVPALIKVASLDLSHRAYIVTEEGVVVDERLLRPWRRQRPRQRVVPLGNIRGVRPGQDRWERLFGLGTVYLETVDGGAFEVGPIANPQRFIEGLLGQILAAEDYLDYGDV